MDGGVAEEFYCADDVLTYAAALPCFGIVSKVAGGGKGGDDYFYLRLPDEWQTRSETFVEAAKAVYQYDKTVLASVHETRKALKLGNKEAESWFSCPTEVGLHVSIGKHALGERIEFEIEKMMSYENQVKKPSSFDRSKVVARWVAIRVNLKQTVELVSSSHITIAACGFRQ